ncbi:MAG: hypothetical protein ABIL68_05960 [bacterium]
MGKRIGFFIFIIGLLVRNTLPAGVTVLGDLTHEKNVLPGETYSGVIIILNTGEEPEEIKVYQTDYLFFRDGTSVYGNPGEVLRSNAAWISFSQKRFTVAPKQRQTVHYTVEVARREDLSGTYWSVLMVEAVPRISPESMEKSGLGIRTVLRYGVQMISHIGNSGTRELKFLGSKLLNEEGKKILQVDIENTGERLLRPEVWAEFYDKNGVSISTFEGMKLRTYPGTSVRYKIDVSSAPGGTYKVLVVADCGGNDLFGIQYAVQIE